MGWFEKKISMNKKKNPDALKLTLLSFGTNSISKNPEKLRCINSLKIHLLIH